MAPIIKIVTDFINTAAGPWVLAFVLSLIAAVVITWFLAKWIIGMAKFKNDTNEFVAKTNPVLQEIKDKVSYLLGRLDSPPPEPWFQSKSPVELTERGKSVSVDLGAKEWADSKAEQVAHIVKNKEAYQIQQFCFEALILKNKGLLGLPEDFLSDGMTARIQKYAFEIGTSETNLHDIFAIELRNAVLDKLGIPLEHLPD